MARIAGRGSDLYWQSTLCQTTHGRGRRTNLRILRIINLMLHSGLGPLRALGLGIPLTIMLGIRIFMPNVEDQTIPGLTVAQTRDVLSRITLCWPHSSDLRDAHVCMLTDDPPRLTRGPHREAVVVARGILNQRRTLFVRMAATIPGRC